MLRRQRSRARRIAILILFVLAAPTPPFLLAGLPFILVGWLINTLTYGVLVKKRRLITDGPYAWCRNPFYFGTLLSDVGIFLAANPLKLQVAIAAAAYGVIQTIFYRQQIKREERDLLRIHGDAYRDYCARVPNRLLPSVRSAIKNGGFRIRWSFQLALQNRVFTRFVGTAQWVTFLWGVYLWGGGRLWLAKAAYLSLTKSPVAGNLTSLLSQKPFLPTLVAGILLWFMFRIAEEASREQTDTASGCA